MALAVACVGRARKHPPAPERAAKTSATASAASVFPSPIGASMIISPGDAAAWASRRASFWSGRGSGSAKREEKSSVAL